MASVPGHNYFDRIIKDISSGNWQKYQNKGSQVVEFTGPLIAGKETAEMEEKVEKAFAAHYFFGSWVKQLNSGRS